MTGVVIVNWNGRWLLDSCLEAVTARALVPVRSWSQMSARSTPAKFQFERTLPGPTRLHYRNKKFEPVDGFEALFA